MSQSYLHLWEDPLPPSSTLGWAIIKKFQHFVQGVSRSPCFYPEPSATDRSSTNKMERPVGVVGSAATHHNWIYPRQLCEWSQFDSGPYCSFESKIRTSRWMDTVQRAQEREVPPLGRTDRYFVLFMRRGVALYLFEGGKAIFTDLCVSKRRRTQDPNPNP
jgi:hypothetical protein